MRALYRRQRGLSRLLGWSVLLGIVAIWLSQVYEIGHSAAAAELADVAYIAGAVLVISFLVRSYRRNGPPEP